MLPSIVIFSNLVYALGYEISICLVCMTTICPSLFNAMHIKTLVLVPSWGYFVNNLSLDICFSFFLCFWFNVDCCLQVIGPYRSGKSFLLNQLLSLSCYEGAAFTTVKTLFPFGFLFFFFHGMGDCECFNITWLASVIF